MTLDLPTPVIVTGLSVIGSFILAPLYAMVKERNAVADRTNSERIAKLENENISLAKAQSELQAKYETVLTQVAKLTVEVDYLRAQRDELLIRNRAVEELHVTDRVEIARLTSEIKIKDEQIAYLKEEVDELLAAREQPTKYEKKSA